MGVRDWRETRSLVVLGAGGFARECFWFVQDIQPGTDVVFVDDVTDTAEWDTSQGIVPVVKDWHFEEPRRGEADRFRQFLVGTAFPDAKRALVGRALETGLEPAPMLVHPRSVVRPDCSLGRGGIMARDSMLTTHATIGDYVAILDSTVGHDDVVGDYTTCFPGCRVSGGVTLGEGVLLGAGTVVRDGVRIAAGVRTGALACVVKDVVEEGVTLVGVPARPIG